MSRAIPEIIWEDEALLAINKPAGLEVYDLLAKLDKSYPGAQLAHRLDRDTSGILLVAKDEVGQAYLQEQFKSREVIKHYRAIVYGRVKKESGSIDLSIGRSRLDPRRRQAGKDMAGKLREAKTVYQVIKYFKGYTYLEASLLTGRTHQLRVHFQAIGHPILADKVYLPTDKNLIETLKIPGLERQALHAYYLKINIPGGILKEFTAPLPVDFQAALDYLEDKC